jgi:hypothetical protein
MRDYCKGHVAAIFVTAMLAGCGGDGGSTKTGTPSVGGHDLTTSTGGASGDRGGSGGSGGGQKATEGGSQPIGGSTSSVGGATTTGGAWTNGGSSTSGGISAGGAAGSHSGGSSNGIGGATNQAGASSCVAPACCVPMVLDPIRVEVYQIRDAAIVNLVIEVRDPASVDGTWAPFAEVTTDWGGTQSCTAERRYGIAAHFVALRCPPVAMSTPFTCGTLTDVQVRLRAEIYADTTPFGPVCVGSSDGPSTTFAVPVECPTCPSSSSYFGYQPCDYPTAPTPSSIAQCSYFLPCTCIVNEATGVKAWSCPQP